jgi:hypothetical protein
MCFPLESNSAGLCAPRQRHDHHRSLAMPGLHPAARASVHQLRALCRHETQPSKEQLETHPACDRGMRRPSGDFTIPACTYCWHANVHSTAGTEHCSTTVNKAQYSDTSKVDAAVKIL